MGATETELRREAEMQRARMGDTLDAIGDRLSPPRMIERRKAAVGQRWQRMKESVMGSPGYQEPITQRMREGAGSAMQSAEGVVQSAAERVQHAPEMLAEQTRGNPLVAGAVAMGIGALIATVVPATRTEQRLVQEAQPQLQQAASELKSAGQDVAQQAKSHAQEAGEELKSSASDAAGSVKEQTRDSAERVREPDNGNPA